MIRFRKVEVQMMITKDVVKVFTRGNYYRLRLEEYGFVHDQPIKRYKNHILHVPLIKEVRKFIREKNNMFMAFIMGMEVKIYTNLPPKHFTDRMLLTFGEKVCIGFPLVLLYQHYEQGFRDYRAYSNMGQRTRFDKVPIKIFK